MIQISAEDVVGRATEALRTRSKWLLSRFGDGEGLAMRSIDVDDPTAVENLPWRKHLGEVPVRAQKIAWLTLVKETVGVSDVLGLHGDDVPLKFRPSGEAVRKLPEAEGKVECAANIHLHLLEKNLYQPIVDAAEGVWIVSGHDLVQPVRDTLWKGRDPGKVFRFELPLQNRYFGQVTTWKTWQGIYRNLRKVDMTGCVVFVGGGVPGKAILARLMTCGGVVLDVGSVLDQWAGFATRGRGKGPGVRSDKNMLKG